MIDAYLAAMKQYTIFDGRTSRSNYWMYTLAFALLMLAALFLEGIFGLGSQDVHPLMGIVSIAHLAPNLSATARRLHDTGHSAWWILLSPITLIFLVQSGTTGPNGYGPAPTDTPDIGSEAGVQAAPVARASAPQTSLTDELERLAKLRASGSLTEAEFDLMKSRLLANLR